jgi:ankyrin repeat protein
LISTPLYHAAFSPAFQDTVDLFMSKGVSIDSAVTETGSTLLMVTTEMGDLAKVQYLIEKGANVNARDNMGYTALHRAAEMGHLSLVQFLMRVGAVYSSVNQHTPFSLAATQGQQQVTSYFKGYGYTK